MNCIITYQKSNGEIFIRPYNHSMIGKRVGDESSMGWKILDIHYRYKDNYICYDDYMRIFRKQVQERQNKKLIRFMIRKLSKWA